MSKKPDQATALAGILKARREVDTPAAAAPAVTARATPPASPMPSPALVAAPPAVAEAPKRVRRGKSSDPNYDQYSVWLQKATRKKVNRALDDDDAGQDFSELVQELLEKWLASRT